MAAPSADGRVRRANADIPRNSGWDNLLALVYFVWAEYQEKVKGRPRDGSTPRSRPRDPGNDSEPLVTTPE
jgi:hypothetical protein